MARDITVIHFDDEFSDMLNILPRRFSRLAYMFYRAGSDKVRVTNPGELDVAALGEGAVGREFDSPSGNDQKFHYVFLGCVNAPAGIEKMFSAKMLFIVDVLRYQSGSVRQEKTAEQSIESLIELEVKLDSIVVFTALQGTDLAGIRSKYPGVQIISKMSSEELDKRFLTLLEASLSDE